ncbi:MAG: restriction endonuclease [Clostridia bacterium]|nr:restriction endonuclease [Clostridia bacterium]
MDIVDILQAFVNGVIALWPIYGFVLLWGGFRLLFKRLDEDRITGSGINQIDRMNQESFTNFIHGFFYDKGIDVTTVHEEIGYYGAELILTKDQCRVAVRLVIDNKPLSVIALQEVYSAKGYYHCENALIITNQEFTSAAQDYALAHGIILWGRERLIKELLAYRFKL